MKNNLQYRRTDKAIVSAFIKLVHDKPFEQITVQDILEEALVSRYTFYAHYHDKYEIAEMLQAKFYEEFQVFIKELSQDTLISQDGNPSRDHHDSIDQLNSSFISKNSETFQALKNIRTETVDVFHLLQDGFKNKYLLTEKSDTAQLEANLYAGMMAAVMSYYADAGYHEHVNISKPALKAMINVTTYSMGLNEPEAREKAASYLKKLIAD